jgi:F-box and WD-40 domain protein CDC4
LLSSHTSSDDGVVTSLAVDDDYIVIGMANSKIHIFNAHNGTFLRTLTGHELGVWCLTLVSAAKNTGEPSEDAERVAYESDSLFTGSRFKGKKRRVTSWTDTRSPSGHAQHRPFSGVNFEDDDDRDAAYGSMMDDSEAPEPLPRARRMRQSDVCGAAVGWGQKDAIIISGGCDRDVKVWNVTTG